MRRTNSVFTVPYRRKREGRTNYRKRMKLLLSGKRRLVVRKSVKGMYASITEYHAQGDRILASASSAELKKLGWNFSGGNLPGAYLVGLLLGTKAKKLSITEAILDIGLYTPVKKSRIYAVLAGVLDAGVSVPHGEDVLPDKERMQGGHIVKYAQEAGSQGMQFAAYRKGNNDAASIPSQFTQLKAKIVEGQ